MCQQMEAGGQRAMLAGRVTVYGWESTVLSNESILILHAVKQTPL